MNWPLSNDYNEAVQNPATAFGDKDLKAGETPAGPLGIPVPRSGNFADVYQVKGGDGSVWAIKCFTRKVTGLRERYQKIDEHLKKSGLPFSVGFAYQEEGIRVKGAWYPIVKMEWVEGFTLNEFIRDNADKPQTLQALLSMWTRLSKRLRESELAHADIQHGNVLLVPGFTAAKLGLKLIDYDGMWVPALAGKHSGELGHSSYQHPFRSRDRLFGPDVDRFPHLVVAAALRGTILGGPEVWKQFDNGDNLLFREEDLKNPAESALIKRLAEFKDPALNCLVAHLAVSATKPLDKTPWLDQLLPEDKAPLLTPVQEKEAAQVLGFALQRKGTETQKSLPTMPAKAVAAESWGDLAGAGKSTPNVFSDLPTRVTPAKKSKMPLIVGGVVALAAAIGLFFALGGKKQKEEDLVKGPPVELKDKDKKKEEEKKAEEKKKDEDKKAEEKKKEDPPVEKKDSLVLVANPAKLKAIRTLDAKFKVVLPAPGKNDSLVALTQAGDGLQLLDLNDDAESPLIPLPGGNYEKLAVSPDGKFAVAGDATGQLAFVTLPEGKIVGQQPGDGKPVIDIAVLIDNATAAILPAGGKTLVLRDLSTGAMKGEAQVDGALDLAASPARNEVLVGAAGSLSLWNNETKTISTDKAKSFPLCVGFLPDGRQLHGMKTPSGRFIARVMENGTSREIVQTLSPFTALAASPNNKWLAAVSKDGISLGLVAEARNGFHHPTTKPVAGAAFLDAKRLLATFDDGETVVYEITEPQAAAVTPEGAKEFKQIHEIAGEATLNALDFNGTGTAIYWGSASNAKVSGYDIAANKPLPAFDAGSGVLSLRSTKSGRLVVQTAPNLYKIWKSPGSGEAELITLKSELAFPQVNAAGETVLYAHGNRVSYYDAATMRSLGWAPHDVGRKIRHFELSPSGGVIVSVDDTGEIAVTLRSQQFLPLRFHDDTKNTIRVAAAPDSSLIAGYGIGNDVRVFSPVDKKVKYTLSHGAPVVDARFTPDGRGLVTVGKDKQAIIWSLEGAKIASAALSDIPSALAVSRDGRKLAVAVGDGPVGKIAVLTLPYPGEPLAPRPSAAVVAALPIKTVPPVPQPPPGDAPKFKEGLGLVFDMPAVADAVRTVGFTLDNKKLVVVAKAGKATVYDLETMKNIGEIEIDKGDCTAAAVEGKTLYAATKDNRIRMFDINTLKLIKETDPSRTAIRGIFPFGDGETILSRDDDLFRVWKIKTGKYSTYNIPGASIDPTRYVLSPATAGRRVFAQDRGELLRWGADTGQPRAVLADFNGTITHLAISPGGTRIAATVGGYIRVCDTNGKLIADIPTGTDIQYGLHFVDQGKKVLAASPRIGVRVWDAVNGKIVNSFPGEFSLYETSAVSQDGKWLAMVCSLRDGPKGALDRHRLSLWRLVPEEKKKP